MLKRALIQHGDPSDVKVSWKVDFASFFMSRRIFHQFCVFIKKQNLHSWSAGRLSRKHSFLRQPISFDGTEISPWMSLLSRTMGKCTEGRHMTREATAMQERGKFRWT